MNLSVSLSLMLFRAPGKWAAQELAALQIGGSNRRFVAAFADGRRLLASAGPNRGVTASHGGNAVSTGRVSGGRKLVLYKKEGCCLCDGIKEKLEAVFSMGGENSLGGVQLEVRDISTNSEWEEAYQYEIPVLSRLNDDGCEKVLPRFSPRLSLEQLQKKLSEALE
eukprot:c9046_g1_i1 orf=383-880(-)